MTVAAAMLGDNRRVMVGPPTERSGVLKSVPAGSIAGVPLHVSSIFAKHQKE
jgi:hypothetical protein